MQNPSDSERAKIVSQSRKLPLVYISTVSWKDEKGFFFTLNEEGRHVFRLFSRKDVQIKTCSAVYVTATERM